MASDKKILITGGTGFIGSALTRTLAADNKKEIFVLSRSAQIPKSLKAVEDSIELVPGDILKPETYEKNIRRASPDVVYHLAWYVKPGEYLNSPLNLDYLRRSLDFAEFIFNTGTKKLISTGTCFEYDVDYGYLSETTPEKPKNLYSASKLALKCVLEQLSSRYGVSSIWARLFYQYGEYENPNRLVPHVINSLINNKKIELKSHGLQVRDYLHVSDVAQGLVLLLKENKTSVYNIGSGRPVTVRELVNEIEGALGKKGQYHLYPRQRHLMSRCSYVQTTRNSKNWVSGKRLICALIYKMFWRLEHNGICMSSMQQPQGTICYLHF